MAFAIDNCPVAPYKMSCSDSLRMSFGVHGSKSFSIDAIRDIAGNRRRIFLKALDVQKSLIGEPESARYEFRVWGIWQVSC